MGSTRGDFGASPEHKQCTAMSRRSGQRCKGVAVLTSATQKCRMHGGNAGHAIGANNSQFKTGRHSKYLPSKLDELYREALSNPDLLELADHIALLEARIQQILEASKDTPVPRWSTFKDLFDVLTTVILSGDVEAVTDKLANIHTLLDAGVKWDSTWDQVQETMEQLRRLTDTEVKRKKELNQMVPVERVIILMAAVSTAVKRHVTNPDEIRAIHRELQMMHGGDSALGNLQLKRVGPEVIDVKPRGKRFDRTAAEEGNEGTDTDMEA